jgi:hypothetical protein
MNLKKLKNLNLSKTGFGVGSGLGPVLAKGRFLLLNFSWFLILVPMLNFFSKFESAFWVVGINNQTRNWNLKRPKIEIGQHW